MLNATLARSRATFDVTLWSCTSRLSASAGGVKRGF